jgi:hypothetical protein
MNAPNGEGTPFAPGKISGVADTIEKARATAQAVLWATSSEFSMPDSEPVGIGRVDGGGAPGDPPPGGVVRLNRPAIQPPAEEGRIAPYRRRIGG